MVASLNTFSVAGLWKLSLRVFAQVPRAHRVQNRAEAIAAGFHAKNFEQSRLLTRFSA
jgi:hypothetical protein